MKVYTKKTARLRDRARRAAKEMRKAAGKVDEEDVFPAGLLEHLWEAGFMTLRVPKKYGGGGATLSEASMVVEELARAGGAAGLIVLLQALGVAAVLEANDEKKEKLFLEKIVDGRQLLAFALSEPEPGPGDKAIITTAKKKKSEYIIRGKKTFVSGAREADLAIVFCVTNPQAGLRKAMSAFVVEAGTTGMLPGRELVKSGLRGVPAVELVFEGCRVKAKARLGRAGSGYAIADRAMISTAPLAAALACGLLAEAVDHVLSMLRTRGPGASPLSEFQPLELALAEMTAGLDSSRALTWVASRSMEEGIPDAERLAREAKWLATEAAVTGIDLACRLMGIEGSLRGTTLERLSRDARASQLVLGPNHIHRIEVARKLLGGKV